MEEQIGLLASVSARSGSIYLGWKSMLTTLAGLSRLYILRPTLQVETRGLNRIRPKKRS
jgi:hypothetical protein